MLFTQILQMLIFCHISQYDSLSTSLLFLFHPSSFVSAPVLRSAHTPKPADLVVHFPQKPG